MILGGAAAALAALVAACTRQSGDQAQETATAATERALTPACTDGDEPTQEQTEGPFFTPDSPEKADMSGDVDGGTKLVLTGGVMSTSCEPVRRALLDFWQADDDGNYDNEGFRLRGHQFTDDRGRYSLTTVVPAFYTGRTRHIHVKVQAEGGPVLTTQLYFPDEPGNADDGIFDEALVMQLEDGADGKNGSFDFVVAT
jgi:protocatechuate 3,4-dioxygenase beta subunit